MTYDRFLAQIRDRGGYATLQQAEQALLAVLEVLAPQLSPSTAHALTDELPAIVTEALERQSGQERQAQPLNSEEFCRRLAALTEMRVPTARWYAATVLTSLARDLPPAMTARILDDLPYDYGPMFGELS